MDKSGGQNTPYIPFIKACYSNIHQGAQNQDKDRSKFKRFRFENELQDIVLGQKHASNDNISLWVQRLKS